MSGRCRKLCVNIYKTMKYVLMSILSLCGLFGCKGYADLSVDEFEKMIAGDRSVQLVDVRTPQEYAAGLEPVDDAWYGARLAD